MCCGLTLSRNCKPLPFLARKWSIRVSNSPTSLCPYTQPLQPPRALPRLFRARHMRACVPPRAWRTRPVRIPYMTFVSTHRQSIPLACSSRALPCTRPARDPRVPHVRRTRGPNACIVHPYAKAQLRKTPMQTTKDFIQMHQLEERVRCAGGKRLEESDPNTEHINRPHFRGQGPCSDILTASWFSKGGRKIVNT